MDNDDNDSAGIIITGIPYGNSTITPTASLFDKQPLSGNNHDIAVTVEGNGNQLIAIKNGETVLV